MKASSRQITASRLNITQIHTHSKQTSIFYRWIHTIRSLNRFICIDIFFYSANFAVKVRFHTFYVLTAKSKVISLSLMSLKKGSHNDSLFFYWDKIENIKNCKRKISSLCIIKRFIKITHLLTMFTPACESHRQIVENISLSYDALQNRRDKWF